MKEEMKAAIFSSTLALLALSLVAFVTAASATDRPPKKKRIPPPAAQNPNVGRIVPGPNPEHHSEPGHVTHIRPTTPDADKDHDKEERVEREHHERADGRVDARIPRHVEAGHPPVVVHGVVTHRVPPRPGHPPIAVGSGPEGGVALPQTVSPASGIVTRPAAHRQLFYVYSVRCPNSISGVPEPNIHRCSASVNSLRVGDSLTPEAVSCIQSATAEKFKSGFSTACKIEKIDQCGNGPCTNVAH